MYNNLDAVSQVSNLQFHNVTCFNVYKSSFYYGTAHKDAWSIQTKNLDNSNNVVKELSKEPLSLVMYDG